MPNFAQRSRETELMDEENISFEEFHDCLKQLEVINHLTLAFRPTLQWLKPRLKQPATLTILDAASGGGDMLRQIARLAAKQLSTTQLNVAQANVIRSNPSQPSTTSADPRLSLIGVDLNPWSKKSAEAVTDIPLQGQHYAIHHETGNIFAFEPDKPIDIVICSLFTHHLTDAQIVEFLRWLDRRAKRGWFINDLHRHPLPYHFIKMATKLFSRNRLIRNDAAVSVARSFTKSDWYRLLEQAGLRDRARVSWYFPFRICVECDKLQQVEVKEGQWQT